MVAHGTFDIPWPDSPVEPSTDSTYTKEATIMSTITTVVADPPTERVVVQRLKVGYDLLLDSAPETFALMCKLAWPTLERFHGDLYHDADWLRRQLTDPHRHAESFTFYYGIGTDGTVCSLGVDDCLQRAGDAGQLWQIMLTMDERKRTFVTAVRLNTEHRARFHGCDQCAADGPAPYEGSTERPSDPSSRCCVVALCAECAHRDVEMLYEVQASRVEAGFYRGVVFYE